MLFSQLELKHFFYLLVSYVCDQFLPGEEHVCLLLEHPPSEVWTLRVCPAPPDPQYTF